MRPKKAGDDSKTVLILFGVGAALVLAALISALMKGWATFDPLVTASIIGVGLLLIVIYERLGDMYKELLTISLRLERLDATQAQDAAGDAKQSAPSAKEEINIA
jgi:hypothetical protein